ncbi:MAG TPA: tail fiber domain-containing protein, partial [Candidatus Thermoplasmatota archaeon]|nr:tail fiber domain-containing protein [Candidatus Thermoplasmatota archaeon]
AIQPNGVPSAGVSLAPGAGAWSTLSDRNAKGFFEPVDGRDVLQQLAGLDVSTWTYNSQAPTIRHMGPVAQDFRAAFGLGESDTTISTVDADGVAFAAIQGLYAELQDRDARITALEHQNSVLEDRLAHIEAMLTQAGVGLPLL